MGLNSDKTFKVFLYYLLYVASADALTNRRRRAANIVRVLCQSEEGDHVAY